MRKPVAIDLRKLREAQHDYKLSQTVKVEVEDELVDTEREATVDMNILKRKRNGELSSMMNQYLRKQGRDPIIGIFKGKDRYTLIEHSEVIEAVREVVGRDKVMGNYYCTPAKLYLYYFPDKWEKDFESSTTLGDVIKFGYRITNSLDGSLGLSGHLVAHRLVCSNGMLAEDFIESSFHKHTKNTEMEQFEEELEDLIGEDADLSFEEVLEKYEEASELEAETEVVLEQVNIPESLEEVVVSECRERDTLWNIYDEMTRAITHGYRENSDGVKVKAADYSEQTLENLHKQANKVIKLAEDGV